MPPLNSVIKEILLISALLAAVLFVFVAVLLGVLAVYSRGRPEPFLDENGKPLAGSISEKTFVDIGGVRQGMFIRGKNTGNPVLLFVHGGPGFPEYFLFEKYPSALEDHYTVCYWEQRGGGLSYAPSVAPESMNFGQLASDTIDVTNYLRRRFNREKIYLMAHCGGTPFAIQAAAKAPQLYHAYIGMAQITRQIESEKLAYRYILERYSASGNRKALEELGKFRVLENDSDVAPYFNSLIRDESMHDLGIGTMRTMKSVFEDVFIAVWLARAYTLREKANIWISKFSFIGKTAIRDEVLNVDIPARVARLDIPVYFFSGKYDLTVNAGLAKAYLEKLDAPVKGFYTFSESAHSPVFEEPAKVVEIMVKDVLRGKTSMADKYMPLR